MNRTRVIARIRWRTEREGGRTLLPNGIRYSTIAEFDPPPARWPEEAWSVIVEPVQPEHWPHEGEYFLSFLAGEAAPASTLMNGVTFRLLEGRAIVADGEIMKTP